MFLYVYRRPVEQNKLTKMDIIVDKGVRAKCAHTQQYEDKNKPKVTFLGHAKNTEILAHGHAKNPSTKWCNKLYM